MSAKEMEISLLQNGMFGDTSSREEVSVQVTGKDVLKAAGEAAWSQRKNVAILLPLVFAAGCAVVPDVPSGVTAPQNYNAWGRWFVNNPEAAITTIATAAGAVGGLGGLVASTAGAARAMSEAAANNQQISMPRLIASVGMGGLTEAIETGIKAGAATCGAEVFIAGAPVESIKFLGTIFTSSLFLETVTETAYGFFRPLQRV